MTTTTTIHPLSAAQYDAKPPVPSHIPRPYMVKKLPNTHLRQLLPKFLIMIGAPNARVTLLRPRRHALLITRRSPRGGSIDFRAAAGGEAVLDVSDSVGAEEGRGVRGEEEGCIGRTLARDMWEGSGVVAEKKRCGWTEMGRLQGYIGTIQEMRARRNIHKKDVIERKGTHL